jgi:DNA-3-methyladenine glycosylase
MTTTCGRHRSRVFTTSEALEVAELEALTSAELTDFFARPPLTVAPELLGLTLLVDGVGGVIVETEAYDQDDPASHSHRGLTSRNQAMFGPPAHAYVYRSYGMHWCLNFVCAAEGSGAAVLVRALEPTHGLREMHERRGVTAVKLLCSGPGRLGQALAVDERLDGQTLAAAPFRLLKPQTAAVQTIASGPRIGISRGAELPWRFYVAESPYLSRKPPAGG